MGIRKPGLTVAEARRLAAIRSAASEQMADGSPGVIVPMRAPSGRSKAGDGTPESSKQGGGNRTPGPSKEGGGNGTPPAARAPSPAKARTAPIAPATPVPRPLPAPVVKTQVFVSALLPEAGVSPVFDILTRQYPPQKALQMILRRALDDYEDMLADASFQNAPATYAADQTTPSGTLVQTSHMMPKKLLTLARAHFDPLGLESTRAFGFKLATAALAVFFFRESGGRRP